MRVYVVLHCQPPEEKAIRVFKNKEDAARVAASCNNALSDVERLREFYEVKEFDVW